MSTKKKHVPAKSSSVKSKPNIEPVTDFFDNLDNKAYLLVFGLILFIEIIVFRNYFFERIYSFKDIGSDSLIAMYPAMYHTADYIAKYGIPKWSFSFGMGQSMFPFFLRDPFDIFLYLAGKDHILYGLVYKEIAKILCSGLLFFFYLKTLKLSNYTSIIGGLLFAFCGFMIVGGSGWYMFSFEVFNMALLLLAFELLFSRQQWYLFPIAIFFIGISMPFNLYIYGFFLACYALFRHLQTGVFNFKKLGALFLKMAALGIVGLLLSAPFLLENIAQLLESPRGSGSSSYLGSLSSAPLFHLVDKKQLGTGIMRLFSSDILGSGDSFKGWGNILEAPAFYCGLPCLLLLPQVFQFLDKRVRLVFVAFLTVWLLPFIFPYLRHAFWLFTGDYYRAYSFFVAFIFLYYTLQALEFVVKKGKINRVVLIVTLLILLILINYPFFDTDIVNPDVSFFVMAMLIVYGLILFFIPIQKNPVYLKWIFLLAVVVELSYLSGISVNERNAVTTSELSKKTGFNDYTVDALNYIKHIDKSPFYRIDKNYSSPPTIYNAFDDGMAQGYYGTSCYSSFNQEYYIKYMELMGMVNKNNERETRWVWGLLFHPILESENNVKYILTHAMSTPLWRICCDSLTQIGDVKILRSKFTMPFGYTYDHYMKESSFDSLRYAQKDYVTLQTCVLKDADAKTISGLKKFQLKDAGSIKAFNTDVWNEEVNELKKDTLTISQFSQNHIAGKINASEDKIMYLSIPYDGGWNLKVDGQKTNKIIIDGGMIGVMLKKGEHSIELNYDLRFFNKGLLLAILGILIYLGCWFFMKRKPKIVS